MMMMMMMIERDGIGDHDDVQKKVHHRSGLEER